MLYFSELYDFIKEFLMTLNCIPEIKSSQL